MAVAALKGGVASGAFSLCVVGCLLGAVVWAWLAGHGPWAVSWLPWFLPLRGDPNLASALVAQTVKSMPAMQEMEVWCLGWKDPLEEEMATHSSILVGKSHGQRSLAGYSLWSHNSDTTEHMTVSRSMLQMALFHVLQLSNIPLYTHTRTHTHTHTHTPRCFLFIFSSVQLVSHVWLFATMDCSTPGLPVHHQLPGFTQTHVHWVSDTIQPSHHSLSSPSPPTFNLSQHQGLFQWVTSSNHVAKVLEFQLQNHHSNEFSGLISFRMDWLDLLAVQRTLKSCLLQHHSSKASILQCSAFFIIQLSYPYMTTVKAIALIRWTVVGKVMSAFL